MVFVPVWDKNGAPHDTAMRQDAKKIDLDRFLSLIQARPFSPPSQTHLPRVYFSAEEKLAQ